MSSTTNMLKQRELNILGQQTALTDRPEMKKYWGMRIKYFQCSSRFQPLQRKRAPTLGYIAALTRQNLRTRGLYQGEAETH
jgi:hypothetical protein